MADTLKTLYDEAIKRANEVVVAMNSHESQSKIKELKKASKAAVGTYNEKIAEAYYKRLASEHGAEAIKVALEANETAIPDVIGISFKDTESDMAHMEVTKPIIKLNLIKMESAIGREYFHTPTWFSRINVLARLMAVALNKELGGSATFQYIVDEAAKEFELDESANPTSNSSMVKAFQKVIDDILWIGDKTDAKGNPVNGIKFDGRNWAYIRECMSKQGGKIGEVLYGSPAKCCELVCDSINMILTNKGNTLKCN